MAVEIVNARSPRSETRSALASALVAEMSETEAIGMGCARPLGEASAQTAAVLAGFIRISAGVETQPCCACEIGHIYALVGHTGLGQAEGVVVVTGCAQWLVDCTGVAVAGVAFRTLFWS